MRLRWLAFGEILKSCAMFEVDVANAHHRAISRYPSGLVRINMHIAGVEKVMEAVRYMI